MVRPTSTFGTRETRFHLYSNENRGRTKDYMFIDQQVRNYIEFGGSVFYVYKLIGFRNTDGGIDDLTTIQDTVLMENPLGKVYAKEVIPIYGFTKIDKSMFELLAMGLNITSSEITQIVFHYNDMIERLGRKFMSGDIIEVGFLKDVDLLDPDATPATRFFKVDTSQRNKNGWDPHYQQHLWEINVSSLVDSPEYAEILNATSNTNGSHGGGSGTEDDGTNGNGSQIVINGDDDPDTNSGVSGSAMSIYDKETQIMDALLSEAEKDVEYLGTTQHQLYMEVDEETGKPKVYDYFYEAWGNDGVPTNYNPTEVNYGRTFPEHPTEGDYFLRIDYQIPRLYYYKHGTWNLVEFDNRPKWSGIPELLKWIAQDESKFRNDEGELENHRQNLREVAMSRAIYKPGWK